MQDGQRQGISAYRTDRKMDYPLTVRTDGRNIRLAIRRTERRSTCLRTARNTETDRKLEYKPTGQTERRSIRLQDGQIEIVPAYRTDKKTEFPPTG